jgi:prepilin-type N-terminal cleavage/methylation domain-containing protein
MGPVSHRNRPGSRRQGGFTLVEVMITLGVLGFGLLTLAQMQLHAMRQGSQGRHTSDAASIARSYLEQATRVPWTELTAAEAAGTWVAPGWDGAPAAQVTVRRPGAAGATVERTYTVAWRVENIGAAPVCLRDVEVRVSWAEEQMSVPKSMVVGTRRFNQGGTSC